MKIPFPCVLLCLVSACDDGAPAGRQSEVDASREDGCAAPDAPGVCAGPAFQVAPQVVDFGTVQQGCNSPDRTFTVYNACPQQVRWVGASLIASGDTAMPMTAN